MSDNAAMDLNDYSTTGSRSYDGETQLLDFFTEQPNPQLSKGSEKALAEIAAVIHKNAPRLTKGQLELAVGWLKRWKCNDYPIRGQFEFGMHLHRLKESTEQVALRRKAQWKLLQALAVAALFTMALVATVLCYFTSPPWYVSSGFVLLTFALFSWTQALAVKAIDISVDQDRRYVMQSLRDAGTTTELIEAGLYNHMKGVMFESGKPYDEKLARQLMSVERERISDALYLDPNGYFDPWNWEEVKETSKPVDCT
jgi:hypothetical protein